MSIDAGEMRAQIYFYEPTEKKDADGYRPTAPADMPHLAHSCNARWRRDSSREVARRDGDYSVETGNFVIRYHPGLSRKMRVKFQGRLYEIEDIGLYRGDPAWLDVRVKREKQAGDVT